MGYEFTNWGQNYSSKAAALLEPTSSQQISQIIQRAREKKSTLRAMGAGHSWSDIVCTKGEIIRIDRMDKVIDVDKTRNRIRVQAGIRLKHLTEHADRMGMGLSNLGSISEQSLAGATSTGTHGTGITYGVIASGIKSATLVDGRGEIHFLEEDDPRLNGVRVSLGALGILTEIEFQLEPAFGLQETRWKLPFEEALEQMPELIREHEHIKFWWLPHTNYVACSAFNRSELPWTPQSRAGQQADLVLNKYVFDWVLRAGTRAPLVVPAINMVVGAAYLKPRSRVDRSDKVFGLSMPPVHLEVEYGVPVEHCSEFLSRVRDLIRSENLHITFIQELRFVAADEIWMSNSYGRESCQFGAYMASGPDTQRYFAGVAKIAEDYQGRPHWGKDFTHTRDQLAELYPRYEDFEDLRREFDPDGVFVNDFISRCFTL